MKITAVQLNKVKNSEGTLRAFANITIDDEFVVKGLKVVDGKNGLFVSMPSTKGADGEYYDDAFPITKDCSEYVTECVLDEYNKTDETPKKKRR